MRNWTPALALVLALLGGAPAVPQEPVDDPIWTPEIPEPLAGPYIVDPATLISLDRPPQNGSCMGAGRLHFSCLVYRDDRMKAARESLGHNPFSIPALQIVQKTIIGDLKSIRQPQYGGTAAQRLDPNFLSFAGVRIELVGVINRMDRQFNRDAVPGHGKPLACGEISAIYRFGYEGHLPTTVPGARYYRSRLPVTMNVVFPAVPWSGEVGCAEVAKRWLSYVDAVKKDLPAAEKQKHAEVIASTLRPEDIDRIELNMQGSRVPASEDAYNAGEPDQDYRTDFGSLATYIIRVFRWVPDAGGGRWRPSYLSNQIDRARLLGLAGDDNSCEENRGKQLNRTALRAWLLSMNPDGKGPNAIGDIDNGLVNIPQEYLACRAISVSPGGAARSGNQPFWNSPDPAQQIISDADIESALTRYRKRYPDSLSFIGTAEEYRTRLNEAACSGCHQTRAIAGFHFPGADRPGASPVNAVFLPASPHFFGDQLRRLATLKVLARGETPTRRVLAASYASRPQNSFAALRPSSDPATPRAQNIQLIGGWGGTCLLKRPAGSVRQWGCAAGLECRGVFVSANQNDVGLCMNPAARPELGEAMQFGTVATRKWGVDRYTRATPAHLPGKPRNTTILTSFLTAPADNSYFAAHQEYYEGNGGVDPFPGESEKDHAIRVRDQGTGGFPAGSLRLSECIGLKAEATCALLASSGFNACLGEVREGIRTPDSCFKIYTSYAGIRACDPANPCRDDYICMNPAGYTQANAKRRFDERKDARKAERDKLPVGSDAAKQLGMTYFGEKMPEAAWLARGGGQGDRRGVCIPPYFVFQFKADGHRVPALP